MRRRDGLVEQKANLVSTNKILEKEIAVIVVIDHSDELADLFQQEIVKKIKAVQKKLKSLAAEKEAVEKEMKKVCSCSNAEVQTCVTEKSC